MIDIKGIKPEKQLFHNVEIDVYAKKVPLEEIAFWPENLRTVLSFSLLTKKFKGELSDIPMEDIIGYLAKRRELQISRLAKSIEMNGVRVPLIILDKGGTLLDGNRRYFACQYIKIKSQKECKSRPTVLDSIPVWVIKNRDIDSRMRQKILAEANFVSDYKVPWSLDVKAKVIYEYFNDCRKKRKMTLEETFEEILDVYGVESTIVRAYDRSMKLSDEFVKSAPRAEKDRYREIVQDKFVYFWEFFNKAYAEKLELTDKQISELKKLFFIMMATDRFKNMKRIEPMIRSIRDKYEWKIMIGSSGSKIDQIEAMHKEQKAIKSAEDKIRNFQRWLLSSDISSFSKAAIKLLGELAKRCQAMIKNK